MAARVPPKVQLGRRVREVRKARKLSQMDMVRNFDWSLSHFQKIERGDLDPRFSTLLKLAESLDVSISDLLKGI